MHQAQVIINFIFSVEFSNQLKFKYKINYWSSNFSIYNLNMLKFHIVQILYDNFIEIIKKSVITVSFFGKNIINILDKDLNFLISLFFSLKFFWSDSDSFGYHR